MTDRNDRRDRATAADVTVAEVKTAIGFVVASVDRLEDSVVRLQQTVREDFASVAEVDIVKQSLHQLREEVTRRLDALEKSARDAGRPVAPEPPPEVRLTRWFLFVGIPSGALGLLALLWELYKRAVALKVGP